MRYINEEYPIPSNFFRVKYPIPPKIFKVKYTIPPKFYMCWEVSFIQKKSVNIRLFTDFLDFIYTDVEHFVTEY